MTDKTVSMYWFFILFIIAFAIVSMVYSVYGAPIDVREMEAIFLSEKVADCISRGGEITLVGNELIKNGVNTNILEVCHLNFGVEKYKEQWNNDQFFVSVTFSAIDGTIFSSSSNGNSNLDSPDCNINVLDSNRKKFPVCVSRTIKSVGEMGEFYSIKIFTGVRKTEKMHSSKKAQISDTISWGVATIIIVLILAIPLLLIKTGAINLNRVSFERVQDPVATKSISGYLLKNYEELLTLRTEKEQPPSEIGKDLGLFLHSLSRNNIEGWNLRISTPLEDPSWWESFFSSDKQVYKKISYTVLFKSEIFSNLFYIRDKSSEKIFVFKFSKEMQGK